MLEGIDADPMSLEERSDYVVARRLMNYEIRGEASAEELEWLCDHPVLWIKALKSAIAETQRVMSLDYERLKSDPRKPVHGDTPDRIVAWREIKAQVTARQVPRKTFEKAAHEKIRAVQDLLPQDQIDQETAGDLILELIYVDLCVQENETEQARKALIGLVRKLSKGRIQ